MSMSLRLSEEAVRSTSYKPDPETLEALTRGDVTGLLAHSHRRWGPLGQMMAGEDDDDESDDEDDADDDEDADDDDLDDDDDEDDDDESEDDDGPEGKKKSKKSTDKDEDQKGQPKTLKDALRKIRAQQDTNDRFHRVVEKARRERDDAQTELQKLKDQGVTDESVKQENTDLKGTNRKLSGQLQDALLRIAFLSDNTYEWQSPAVAMKAADFSKIEISDDGTVVGMAEALEALATDSPFLLKQKESRRKKVEPKKGTTGARPGRKSTSKTAAERQTIREKYRIPS
jgi:hypothetical protein